MNRTYELMFIVRPDMPEEDQDKLVSTLESAITAASGNREERREAGQAAAGIYGPQVP